MSKLFRDGVSPSPQVLEIIVSYMNKVARPVYVGILSLEVRWSLARTQEMLDILEERGVVRPATVEEKLRWNCHSSANMYALVAKPSLSKAYG